MTAIALKLNTATTARAAKTTHRTSGLRHTLARRAELVGVLALMASSAAYALFALGHLG